VEHRSLESTTVLTVARRWPGLRQGFRVRRHGVRGGKPYAEEVYGITSLDPEEADAARLLALVRAGWGIENRLHYVRDVTLGEDACQVSRGVGAAGAGGAAQRQRASAGGGGRGQSRGGHAPPGGPPP
jgi:hypothetical protein